MLLTHMMAMARSRSFPIFPRQHIHSSRFRKIAIRGVRVNQKLFAIIVGTTTALKGRLRKRNMAFFVRNFLHRIVIIRLFHGYSSTIATSLLKGQFRDNFRRPSERPFVRSNKSRTTCMGFVILFLHLQSVRSQNSYYHCTRTLRATRTKEYQLRAMKASISCESAR